MIKISKANIIKLLHRLIGTFLLFFIISQCIVTNLSAQTCSCGGPPLLGSLESLPLSAGNLQLGMTYDYRSISDLVASTTQLDDDTRSRTSRTLLIQSDYSFTSRITLSLSLPIVQQNRDIQSLLGSGENLRTRGIGDIMLLTKYSLIPSSLFSAQSLAIGLGVKFPTGESELRDNALLLSADMQTGTGSYDYILWGATSRIISRKSSLNLFASSLYRINGTNNRFGIGSDGYKFGNEFRLVIGSSANTISNIVQSFGLRYRHSQADKFASSAISSSGGQWIDIETGISTVLTEKIELHIAAQFPIYRKIEGTQFSTSYALSFSLFHNFNLKGSPDEFITK